MAAFSFSLLRKQAAAQNILIFKLRFHISCHITAFGNESRNAATEASKKKMIAINLFLTARAVFPHRHYFKKLSIIPFRKSPLLPISVQSLNINCYVVSAMLLQPVINFVPAT